MMCVSRLCLTRQLLRHRLRGAFEVNLMCFRCSMFVIFKCLNLQGLEPDC